MQVTRAWMMKGVACALLLVGFVAEAVAAPAGGAVQAGTATITSTSATTTITQSSSRAVIDWQSFSIASGQSVIFNQPSTQSATLNRVTGSQLSDIEGSLSANGQVFLVNPNGILIGKGASIDTGTFVATTASIATNSFMASPASANGQYPFDQVTSASASGTIVNNGSITAADGGLVALVAPAVRNSGIITARLGRIELASANIFTLDLYGDDLIRLAVSDQVAGTLKDVSGQPVTAQVSVDGQLRADGGRIVLLSAPAAAGILDSAINLSGVARAQTVAASQQGEIQLLATSGNVNVSGALDATAPAASAAPGTALAGGSIEVNGATVHVLSGARIDVSGPGGGGFVALGGTLSVGNQSLQTGTTTVDYGAFVGACGTAACAADGSGGSGNGGTVRLYSVNGTQLGGELNVSSAQGAVAGTVEVLSNLGTTSLGSMAQVFANTGTGQNAGFVVVIGDELSVATGVRMDMRDYAGNEPNSANHVLYDQADPSLRTYVLSNDPTLTTIQTNFPIVFHAYDPNAQSTYVSQLPPLNDGIEAPGYLTPVGTLRPNGGAPTTVVSTAADALTPIEVSLAPPAPPASPPPDSTPPGGTGSTPDTLIQVFAESGRVAQQVNDGAGEPQVSPAPTTSAVAAATPSAPDALPMIAGGPGVAQIADLGRGGTAGASPDVFNVNYQVVAPAGGAVDAPLADYLCTTPFARNGCRGHAAGR